tara:strand:+ start:392 stop:559 length:168 start_codon:yes stop_codon:yes gene_type:complete
MLGGFNYSFGLYVLNQAAEVATYAIITTVVAKPPVPTSCVVNTYSIFFCISEALT